MKRFRLFCVITFVLALPKLVHAQFTLSGEIRPRTEFRQGFKTLHADNIDPALFTEQRTRISMAYQEKKISTYISLQDVRFWGAVDQIYKSDPSLTSLNQAYATYRFTPVFSVTAGRMELNYDNARFFGNLGWAQQSRSHDLVKFMFADSTWQLHGGIAFNQDAITPEFKKVNSTFYAKTGVQNYKSLQYLWFHKDYSSTSVSLLALNNGAQIGIVDSSDVYFSQTFGTLSSFKAGDFKAVIEAYYQTGDNLTAYMIGFGLTYKGFSKLPIAIGYDRLSGTESTSTKAKSFTPLYGTNHKFYGFMDYFYVGNPHGNVGLQNIYAKFTGKFSKSTALLVHLHHFLSAVEIPNMSSGLGTEIDLVFNHSFSTTTNLKLGFSKMFATESMEVIKGGGSKDAANMWGWVMLTFKPVFFSGN